MGQKRQKQIVLTQRDEDIIKAVKTARCLSADQLHQLTNFPKRSLSNRLRDIKRAGYLSKLEYGRIGGIYLAAWTLGPYFKGYWVPPFRTSNLHELEHQLELNLIVIDSVGRNTPNPFQVFLQDDHIRRRDLRQPLAPEELAYDANPVSVVLPRTLALFSVIFKEPLTGFKKRHLLASPLRMSFAAYRCIAPPHLRFFCLSLRAEPAPVKRAFVPVESKEPSFCFRIESDRH